MSDKSENIQDTGKEKGGVFARLKLGLRKTRNSLADGIVKIVRSEEEIGPHLWEELEDMLLMADVGAPTTSWILSELKGVTYKSRIRNKGEVVGFLKELLVRILEDVHTEEALHVGGPRVILVIGINGSGKTTTIGKLAAKWKGQGQQVVLAAGDTFRAAAVEQLQAWAERIDVTCVRQKSGADPSAVAFDAVQAAVARNADTVIVDTAGRLQTNANLMEELKRLSVSLARLSRTLPTKLSWCSTHRSGKTVYRKPNYLMRRWAWMGWL